MLNSCLGVFTNLSVLKGTGPSWHMTGGTDGVWYIGHEVDLLSHILWFRGLRVWECCCLIWVDEANNKRGAYSFCCHVANGFRGLSS
jgi:hypothetical protein